MSVASTPKHSHSLEHLPAGLTREDLRSELQAFAFQVIGPQLSELAARVQKDLREQLQQNASGSGSSAGEESPSSAQVLACRKMSELAGRIKKDLDSRYSIQHVADEVMRRNVHKRLEKKPSTILNAAVCQELMSEDFEGYDDSTPVVSFQPRAAFASTRDTILQSVQLGRGGTPPRAKQASTPRDDEEDIDGEVDDGPAAARDPSRGSQAPGIAGKIVRHAWFERVVIVVIVLNAIYMGVATDIMATQVYSSTPIELRVLEYIFLCIFILELGLRFWVHGCNLFRRKLAEGKPNPNFYWNVLDCIVIILQLVENAAWGAQTEFAQTTIIDRISVIRILRLIRLVRIIRVIKIFRFVRDLRMIVYAIGKSLSLFFWAIVALALMNYTVSVMFTEMALSRRIELNLIGDDTSEIDKYFGSLIITMLSMFQAVTGGMDWGVLTDCFQTGEFDSSVVIFCVVAYVAFTQIALLNVITGVFLDTAMDSARDERDAYVVRNARVIFQAADHNKNGMITWPDFERALDHPDVQNFFEAVDIHVSEAKALFDLLDASGDGTISAEEFLNGCLRVRGPSKALDLLVLSREMGMLFESYAANAEVLPQDGESRRQSRESMMSKTASPRGAGTEAPGVKSMQHHAGDALVKALPQRKGSEAPPEGQPKTSFSLIREMSGESAVAANDPSMVSFDPLIPGEEHSNCAPSGGASNDGKNPGERYETLSLPGVCSYCGPS